ncbi:MAG: DUF2192 domain-containing protein [Ignisphaera sp.]
MYVLGGIMNIKRKRVAVIVNAWSRIVKENISTREQAVEILKKSYEEMGIEPIRGSSTSPDLYDKDMASLYIIGKFGLAINEELAKEAIENIFSIEVMLEKVVDIVKNVESYDQLCKEYPGICKILDDKLVARLLRYIFTMYYFGFIDRSSFFELLKKTYVVLRPLEETIKRFTRFVIAYEVGKKISENEIKNKTSLNMVKNMIALDIGIPHTLPSTRYVIDVAKHFFEIPQDLINSLKGENK